MSFTASSRRKVETGFSPSLADGMKRIATEMAAAEKRSTNTG